MTGCLLGVSAELIQGRTGLNTDLFGRQCPELGSARAYQTSILAAPWPTPISALSASLIGKCGGFAPAAPLGAMTDAVRAERRRSGTGSARTSEGSRRPREPIARGRARMRDRRMSLGGCAAAVHNALDADKRTTSHESALALNSLRLARIDLRTAWTSYRTSTEVSAKAESKAHRQARR